MSLIKRCIHLLVLFSFFQLNVTSAWGQEMMRAQETDYQLTLQLMNPSTLSKRSLSEDETEETDLDSLSDTTLSLSLRQKLSPTEEEPSKTYYKDYEVQLSLTPRLNSSSTLWTLQELGQGSQDMQELLTYFPWLKTLSVSARGDMIVNNLTSDASFAFSSPQLIALKNTAVRELYLQGKSVLIQKQLTTDRLSLETVTATSMDIGSVIETQSVTVFGGSVHNQGTLKSKTNLRVNLLHHALINPGTIEAPEKVEIHQAQTLVNQGVLSSKNVSLFGDYGANSGVIKAETLEITTLQGLYNTSTGKIQTTSSARLVSLGELHNQGEITSQGLQKLVAQEELKNQGTLKANQHQLKSFKVLENQGKILSTSSQEHQIEADTFRALSPSEITLPHLKVKGNTGQWGGTATHTHSQTLEIGKEFKLNSDLQLTTLHWIWKGDSRSTLETNTAEKGLEAQQIETNSFRGQWKNTGTFVVPAQWKGGLISQVLNQGKIILPKGRELFAHELKNDREGIVEGDGDLKIGMGGGINRGFIQGEDLRVRIHYGTLTNENKLKLRHLEGSGKFENQGQLWMSKGESTIGVKEFINRTPEASMVEGDKDTPQRSQAMVGSEAGSKVTFTTDVKSWLNERGVIVMDHLVFASVPKETKLSQASREDQTHFTNKGLVQTKTLDFYRNYFDNEHTVETEELTFKYLNTGGYLTNKKGSTFRVKGKANVKMQDLINDGEMIFEGDLKGKIHDSRNRGYFEVQGSTCFEQSYHYRFTNQGETRFKGFVQLHKLTNSKTLFCDKGLEVTDFENKAEGSTQVKDSFTVKGKFENRGTLNLQEVKWDPGGGTIENHGTLVLSRKPEPVQDPRQKIDFTKLLTQSSSSPSSVPSKKPLPTLKNTGQMKFEEPMSFAELHNVGRIEALQGLEVKDFKNEATGSIHIKDHFTLNGKFENKGNLHLETVTFKTNQSEIENEGTLLFNVWGDLSHVSLTNKSKGFFKYHNYFYPLRLKSFHNSGNYRWEENPGQAMSVIDRGLSVENFYNRCGTTEISGAVNISKSYINHGELLLKKGTFEYGGDTLVNNGTLRMEEITQEKVIPRVENKGTWSAVQSTLKVKEFHNEDNLEVGLGFYEFDIFRNASKALLTAHSRASLKADTSLETVLKALLKAGPYSEMRIRFRSFNNYGTVQSPDSLAFSGNWNKHHLGTFKVKGTAEFNLHGHNVTSSLFQNVQAEGGIKLHAQTFQTNSSVYTPNTGWDLYLTKHFIVDHTLQLRSLKVWTRELFQIGRSNDDLAELTTTEGPLTISAHSIDARYGKIHGTGDVDLTARDGDLLWGDAVAVPNGGTARHYNTLVGMMYRPFTTYKSNNAYLSSGQNLILRAWHGYLKGHFGLVSSGQNMSFSASKKDIQMICCELVSGKDITVQGQNWTYSRTPVTVCHFGSLDGGLKDMWSQGLTSVPATLQCLGDLNLRVPAFSIVGNNLYVGGSIYKHYSRLKEISISPQAYYEYGSRNHTPGPIYDQSGTVIAGKKIYLNRGHFHLRGSISATKIELDLTSLRAENTEKTRPVQDRSKPIQISLLTVAQGMAESGGLVRQNSRGQLVPRIPYYTSSGKSLNWDEMIFDHFSSMGLPLGVDESLLPLLVHQGMAQQAYTLSVNGHSGSKLFDHILDNTKKTRAESGALVSEDMMNNPLCIVMYFSPYYQNYQLGLAPYLLIPAKDQGTKGYGGSIIAEKSPDEQSIKVKCDKTIDFVNNQVIGDNNIGLYAQERFNRETTLWTRVTQNGKHNVLIEEIANPQQEVISKEGLVETDGGKFLTETGVLTRGAEINRLASHPEGEIKAQNLALQRTHITKEGGKKHTSVRSSNVQNEAIATVGNSHLKSGRSVALTGTKEQAEDTLSVKTKHLSTEAQTQKNIDSTTTKKNNFFATSESTVHRESLVGTPQELHGKQMIVLNLEDGRINGAHVSTPLLDLNAPQGTEFGPTVAPVENRIESSQSSAVGHVEITQIQGQEVALHTVLAAKKVQTHDHPVTLIDVQVNKEWTEIEGKYEEGVRHLRTWSSYQVKGSQIDPGIGAIISLAVCIGTAGTGLVAMAGMNSILTAMGQAAFSALANQATLTMLSTGDMKQTLESMASDAYLKDLAVQVAMAGLVGGGSGGKDLGLLDHLKVSLFRSGVKGLLNMAIKGQDAGSAFKDAVVQGAIDGVGAYGAGQIGKLYTDKSLNFVTHKAAHACVGGVMGALISDDAKRGAISGAIGAVVAETIAETFLLNASDISKEIETEASRQGLVADSPEYQALENQIIHQKMDWTKLGAGIVTLCAGQDVEISLKTATNALENNFAKLLGKILQQSSKKAAKKVGQEGAKAASNTKNTLSHNFKRNNFEVGDRIDLNRFTQKLKGGKDLKDPKSGQILTPERALNSGSGPHGPTYWKLYDKFGKRIGSFTQEGCYVRE